MGYGFLFLPLAFFSIILFIGLVPGIRKELKRGKDASYYRRLQRRIALTIGGGFLLFYVIFPNLFHFYTIYTLRTLTGHNLSWRSPQVYETPESSVRDFFHAEIWELSEEDSAYFSSPSQSFFTQYPEKRYSSQRWKQTPIGKQEKIWTYILGQHQVGISGAEKDTYQLRERIERLLQQEGNYYSYHFQNVEYLYLLSPQERMILRIKYDN